MKKYIAIGLLLALLCGCAAPAGNVESESAVTFTDDLGRSVTVEQPQRVAALLGSFAQVWMLAGGQICATADDAWDDLQLALSADVVNLGGTENLSMELLLSSQPDLVIASTKRAQHLQWQQTLESMGIPVAYFDIADFDDYLRLLQICTDLTGRKDLLHTNGTAVQAKIDGVIAQSASRLAGAPGPSVLCMVASASLLRAKNSDGSVLGGILRDLGCVNIADSNSMILQDLSIEHILQADPDYIFIVQRGDDAAGMREFVKQQILENPVWSSLTAVREGRVYFMDKTLFNLKPNHRWGEAYAIAEEILANG